MWELPEASNIIIAFGTLLAGTAACVGAFVAYSGLDSWKKQNSWHQDYELARRILIAIYRYRDSLYAVRHPAMLHSEMQLDDDAKNGLTKDQVGRQEVIHAYANRWEHHSTRRNELDALLLESDAVWGGDLSDLTAPLKELEHELYLYIVIYLDAHYREDKQLAKEYREILRSKRDILYDFYPEDDEFRTDFKKNMKPLEGYLKTKLGRG